MFSPRVNSLITFLLLYALIGLILMSAAGVAYFTREATGRPPLGHDPDEVAKVRRWAKAWAAAGILHVGFSLWAFDRTTRACPLDADAAEARATRRTVRLATTTGVVGLVGATATALVVDFTPLLTR